MTTAASTAPLTNVTIQTLIDAVAAKGGGVVNLPAGVYTLLDAVHLRSNVRIVGAGVGKTILRRTPSVTSRIPDYLGYGHYECSVENPDLFPVGCGIHIYDKSSFGFYTTVATVTGKSGRLLFLNRPLAHDYSGGNGGHVTRVFSCVEGDGVNDASLENLTLDGNPEETFTLTGCRGGAIFIILCNRITFRNIEVCNYKGDGISFQQSTDIAVEACDIHHNTASGLHPGSGTVRYVMRRNHSHHNGTFGLFYCLRTTHSLAEHNTLEHNGQAGISVGERDTDQLIRHNIVRHNAGPAVEFRPVNNEGGDRTHIVSNTLGPNCLKRGTAEIVIPPRLSDIHIARNTITPSPGRFALALKPGCTRVSFVENVVDGRPQQPEDAITPADQPADPKATWDAPNQGVAPSLGPSQEVLLTTPPSLPVVGPEAVPPQAALHLNIAKLAPTGVR